MRKFLGIAALLCLTALQSQAADDKKDDKSDKDKLKGSWVMSSVEVMGKTIPIPDGKAATLVFDGDKVVMKDPEKKKDENGTFKIDDKKKPKEIDITGPKDNDPKVMETTKFIYELDGETLKLGMSGMGPKGDRPTGFTDKDAVVLIFKLKK